MISADGRAAEAVRPALRSGDAWRFELGMVPTVWYSIDVER